VNTLRGVELQTENKKKASNSEKLLLAPRSSLSSLFNKLIRIIQLTLGCVELFFERGANEREPRNYQAT